MPNAFNVGNVVKQLIWTRMILLTGYCAATIFDICRRMARCGSSSSAFAHRRSADRFRNQRYLTVALQIIGIAAARLLLVGAFTPLAGVLAAGAKVWIAISRFSSHSGDPGVALAQAILAAALAMIGPGAWSIDARRFGRKHIDLSQG
jgi:putative oxidoreductase